MSTTTVDRSGSLTRYPHLDEPFALRGLSSASSPSATIEAFLNDTERRFRGGTSVVCFEVTG